MAEVLKVLVSKQTLDNLRSELKSLREFKESHIHCAKDSPKEKQGLTQDGDGCENEMKLEVKN